MGRGRKSQKKGFHGFSVTPPCTALSQHEVPEVAGWGCVFAPLRFLEDLLPVGKGLGSFGESALLGGWMEPQISGWSRGAGKRKGINARAEVAIQINARAEVVSNVTVFFPIPESRR